MLGALQRCAVPGVVSGGRSDQRQGGHPVGVDIVSIDVTIGEGGGVLHSVGSPSYAGHTPIRHNAAVDGHTVAVITVAVSVCAHSIK